MERGQYVARVRTLSEFADAASGRRSMSIKSLFACRINYFTPEFRHRQLVVLPFNQRQLRKYVGTLLPVVSVW